MAASSESPDPPRRRLVLGDEIYFCVTEGQGIFLDLKRDDYCAIPISPGAVSGVERGPDELVLAALEAHRKDLIEAHLLNEDAQGGEGLQAYKSLVRPSSHIFYPDDQRAFGRTGKLGKDVRLGIADIADFFMASRRASKLLKKQHIHDIVCAVRSRKAPSRGADDLNALRRHTAVYRKLRPWYPRGYLCLYDSLALVEFLALRRLFPSWVFGVQAQPFGAHCWVQAGEFLLNESTEYARQFTPLMLV